MTEQGSERERRYNAWDVSLRQRQVASGTATGRELELADRIEELEGALRGTKPHVVWAYEQLRMWWRGIARDTSDPQAAIAELDRVEGLVVAKIDSALTASEASPRGHEEPPEVEDDMEHLREIGEQRDLLPPPWKPTLTKAQRDHLPNVRAEVTKAMRDEDADLPLVAQFLDELAALAEASPREPCQESWCQLPPDHEGPCSEFVADPATQQKEEREA